MSDQRAMTGFEWLMLLTLASVWAASFFFAAIAVQTVPPLTVALIRVIGAAVILWAALLLIGQPIPRGRTVWVSFFGMGLLNNAIPFSLIFWAQTDLASGVASILNATTPFFTLVVAHFVTADERLSTGKLLGIGLGILGVAVMMGAPTGGGLIPMIAILIAALSYGCAAVFGKRFATLGVAPLAVAAGQVTGSAILLLPVVLVIDQPWQIAAPGWPALWSLAGLAILSTAFAYFLYFRILATAGATNLSLVTLLIPPGAVILGVLFLGERLSLGQGVGLGLIALGLIAIDGRIFRTLR